MGTAMRTFAEATFMIGRGLAASVSVSQHRRISDYVNGNAG
jgi:hypothetical protein